MTQTWYIRFGARSVGPVSARRLQEYARDGELTPDDWVSLDAVRWFRAHKILGLFPESPSRRLRVAAPALAPDTEGDLTFDITLDKTPRASPVAEAATFGPMPSEGAKETRSSGRDDGTGNATAPALARSGGTREVAERSGPVVTAVRLARGAARTMAPFWMLTWRALRATALAMTLAAVWSVRNAYGLVRRRWVERTALETRLASSLWRRRGRVETATATARATDAATASASPSPQATLPEQFGRYRVVRLLGRGGMGSVYLAHDAQLERPVALKVPHFTPEDGPDVLQRFYREARAAATLEHPNVCPVYDVGEIDGRHYVSMAYVEGRPLSDLVDADKRLSQREAAALVRQVAKTMAEAHARGIIHRDLKPANIMINVRRDPVIMDFGLARRTDYRDARLTDPGTVAGTPAYMPPEQFSGDPSRIGPACDVYSLGVVLYELVTGRRPFEGPAVAVLGQLLTQEAPPPSAFLPDLDTQLEAVILKAMARDVADRYASMAELANALGRFLRSGTPAALGDAGAAEADDLVHLSGIFQLPPRKAPGADPSRRSDAASGPARPAAWPWVAVVALLVAAFIFLATREHRSIVVVQLAGIQVNQTTTNIYYLLDGQPISAATLAGPLSLRTGEHEVIAKRPDGTFEARVFDVGRGDDHKTIDVRRASADASAAVKAQVDALLDEDAGVRKTAAENLGRLGERSAVPALINRVADGRWYDSGFTNVPSDPVGGGKSAALEALQKMAPDRVTFALVRAVRASDARVRVWAIRQLTARKESARDGSVVEALAGALKDPDADPHRAGAGENIRRLAAEALMKLDARSTVPALFERVADDNWYNSGYTNVPDDPVGGGKGAALDALRTFAPDQVIPSLNLATKSKSAGVRAWALRELARELETKP